MDRKKGEKNTKDIEECHEPERIHPNAIYGTG
jgi:hypothetical protein